MFLPVRLLQPRGLRNTPSVIHALPHRLRWSSMGVT